MTDIRDLETKRKDAYAFIVRSFKSKVLLPKINSNRALAEALCRPKDLRDKGISVEAEIASMYADLVALKEGRASPSQRIIDGFKAYFENMVSNVDAYLVTPFQNA